MSPVTYLDASALVKLVSEEAESSALSEYLATRMARATSIVGVIELRRAAARQWEVDPMTVALVIGSFEIDRSRRIRRR